MPRPMRRPTSTTTSPLPSGPASGRWKTSGPRTLPLDQGTRADGVQDRADHGATTSSNAHAEIDSQASTRLGGEGGSQPSRRAATPAQVVLRRRAQTRPVTAGSPHAHEDSTSWHLHARPRPEVRRSPLRRSMRLLVLGGGPAGLNAALQGRELNAQVTLIESDRLGGTSINRGPAPVRTLAR